MGEEVVLGFRVIVLFVDFVSKVRFLFLAGSVRFWDVRCLWRGV